MADERPATNTTDVDLEKGHSRPSSSQELKPKTEPESDSLHTNEKTLNNEPEQEPEHNTEPQPVDDPNLVDWDGPDDPENPMNWHDRQKWLNIGLISLLTFVTPLVRRIQDHHTTGSSMFAPGIPAIMVQFGETSSITATFVVSVYILGFAFGPLIVAPVSEMWGRRPLYIWGNIFFVLFSVGTALSQNMDMMMAFRFLMGVAGSVPITIGSGSISDIMPVEMRGRAMSAWALGPLLGPCIGPVAGGYLIRETSWRWVYWLVCIVGGICIPPSFLYMKETYAPILIERKVMKLRKETGNNNLHSKLDSGQSVADKFKIAILRPVKLLFLVPIVTSMALYVAIVYGILLPAHHNLFLCLPRPVHFIVPMIGVVVFSAGLMGVMMCIQNYLLDTFPPYAASVTAALAVLRSLAGALLPPRRPRDVQRPRPRLGQQPPRASSPPP
ncbi:benomyl/methotrexate resistance protein [Verticillium alfalfae VaMs.102]|uniref:Benomyl/methotrexate resistance protein n=1 Tax=Verticillium alfalfae (strain VaMs.102 / ATCC MYA-4576 / FGSC 10136) TaxID=526221 RepID=C9SRV6_VERA1|nr:benomyl/methotrexate resistance protein [Verticillium alfalfae VaMs.102]EEY21521.1 benomyl/methotrexate resistance protein [Verticillium alfalfae VaMs.102]